MDRYHSKFEATMDSVLCYEELSGEMVDATKRNAVRHVRRMHSFDRRIKNACQNSNPDLDEDRPSYMRQTCASLVKRYMFQARKRDMNDKNVSSRTKDTGMNTPSGKRTTKSEDGCGKPRRKHRTKTSLWGATKQIATGGGDKLPFKANKSKCNTFSSEAASPGETTVHLEDQMLDEINVTKHSGVREPVMENFEAVINNASSPVNSLQLDAQSQNAVAIRGPSISSILTLEDAYSDAARDDSFCHFYDSDVDGTVISFEDQDGSVYDSALYKTTSEEVSQRKTPLTTTSLKKLSRTEDLFGVMETAMWLEGCDDDDVGSHGDSSPIECHRLDDLLGSCTDSEFGDLFKDAVIPTQRSSTRSLAKEAASAFSPRLSGSKEFDLHVPIRSHQINDDNKEIKPAGYGFFSRKCSDNKLGTTDGSLQIQKPGLLWMLGGNVLAGVIGAVIASTGSTLSPAAAVESEAEIVTPSSDSAHADDWFFQAASRVSPTHGEEF